MKQKCSEQWDVIYEASFSTRYRKLIFDASVIDEENEEKRAENVYNPMNYC